MLIGEPERGRRIPIGLTSSKAARAAASERLGGRMVAAASLLAVLLLALAVIYVFASRPGGSPPAPTAAQARLAALAHRYLAIADPANHRLEVANDRYKVSEHRNLAAAAADLRSEVATETLFDRQLGAIGFPPAIEAIARALIRANRSRGVLTVRQARSASLARLQSFDRRHAAGDAAVEVQVRLIRKALHLPPPPAG